MAATVDFADILPARVMPFASFKASYPNAKVLVPSKINTRRYSANPYLKYDSSNNPFLYSRNYDGPGQALPYVVAVEQEAWLLDDLRKHGVIEHGDLRLKWQSCMSSVLYQSRIDQGHYIGVITVQRKQSKKYEDIPYDIIFAFAFQAFHIDSIIHKN